MKDNFVFLHPSGMGSPEEIPASSIEDAWTEARKRHSTGGKLYQQIPEWRAINGESHHNDNDRVTPLPELAGK